VWALSTSRSANISRTARRLRQRWKYIPAWKRGARIFVSSIEIWSSMRFKSQLDSALCHRNGDRLGIHSLPAKSGLAPPAIAAISASCSPTSRFATVAAGIPKAHQGRREPSWGLAYVPPATRHSRVAFVRRVARCATSASPRPCPASALLCLRDAIRLRDLRAVENLKLPLLCG